MKKYLKNILLPKNILLIILSVSFYMNLYPGVSFVAIEIPNNIKSYLNNITNYAKSRLVDKNVRPNITVSSSQNLHITLKEISNLNKRELHIIKKRLRKMASSLCAHDISRAIKRGHLKISNRYIKLMLAPDNWLNSLADKINSLCNDLVRRGELRSVASRLDFPGEGHITLATITDMPKSFSKKKIKNIEKKFVNKFNKKFIVNRFSLLKSNSPITPRKYECQARFFF